jgi:hypothetical protein
LTVEPERGGAWASLKPFYVSARLPPMRRLE